MSDLNPGSILGNYRICSLLGRGGMASVYLAEHRLLMEKVALKVLAPEPAANADMVARFLREARSAFRLRHPRIIRIHEVGQIDEVTYFSMDYIEGDTLGSLIAEHKRIPENRVVSISREVLSALAEAHAHGIIHRDLKPDNILLDRGGRVTVTDFGIAKVARETRLTLQGSFVGTVRYTSPEQIQAREVDGRSDLYSWGVVMYEMISGKEPFPGADTAAILYKHVNEPPPPLRPSVPELSEQLERIVLKVLHKDPALRFPSARAMLEAFDGLASAPTRTEILPAGVHGRRFGKNLLRLALEAILLMLLAIQCHRAYRTRSFRPPPSSSEGVDSEEKENPLSVRPDPLISETEFAGTPPVSAPAAVVGPSPKPVQRGVPAETRRAGPPEKSGPADGKEAPAVEKTAVLPEGKVDAPTKTASDDAAEEPYPEARKAFDRLAALRRKLVEELRIYKPVSLRIKALKRDVMEAKKELVEASLHVFHRIDRRYYRAKKERERAGREMFSTHPEIGAIERRIAQIREERRTFRNQLEQVLCAEEMTREFKHILFPKPPPEKPGWADLSALQIRSAKERGVPPFREVPVAGDVSVKMVWIPPGTFVMGDDGGKPDEKPAHPVTLKEGFYIGVSEVTNAQWDAVMGSGSGGAADPSAPVDGVSWNACQDFLSRLNALSDLTYWGYRFRLPTEAEWEYVARTGFPDPRKTPGIRGEGTPVSATPAENGAPHDRFAPKRETGTDSWGVAGMQGGVPEWCSDIYLHDYYRDAPQEDPRGGKEAPRDVTLLKEPLRVFRGGAANGEAWSPAHRGHAPPGEQNGGPGFRLVLEIPESGSPR